LRRPAVSLDRSPGGGRRGRLLRLRQHRMMELPTGDDVASPRMVMVGMVPLAPAALRMLRAGQTFGLLPLPPAPSPRPTASVHQQPQAVPPAAAASGHTSEPAGNAAASTARVLSPSQVPPVDAGSAGSAEVRGGGGGGTAAGGGSGDVTSAGAGDGDGGGGSGSGEDGNEGSDDQGVSAVARLSVEHLLSSAPWAGLPQLLPRGGDGAALLLFLERLASPRVPTSRRSGWRQVGADQPRVDGGGSAGGAGLLEQVRRCSKLEHEHRRQAGDRLALPTDSSAAERRPREVRMLSVCAAIGTPCSLTLPASATASDPWNARQPPPLTPIDTH
jgi:hypothetical protein